MNNKTRKILLISFLIICSFLTTGFSIKEKTPKTVYRVYLEGKSLGIIKSKEELEDYIDKKQNEIKKEYGVDKVYIPSELDIVKEITYDNNITSVKKIYKKIKDISPFTINGYAITIKGIDTKDSEGKNVKGKNQVIYVLDKEIFTEAVDNTVKSFIPAEEYKSFAENPGEKLEGTGNTIEKIIENIYIENKITIKKQKIPVNKTIYQEKEELSKYLLFGTTEEQKKYNVQNEADLSEVAYNNKVSIEELLIANPTLNNESLLSENLEVTIGILKPQFNVVEEEQVVFTEEKNYTTETRYDNNKYVGYSQVVQAGVKGENKVTQKIQKVNGETKNVVTVSTESIKEPINEIIVKGGKAANYSGGGYGTVVATKGQWGWPASCSSISSHFGWRWGTLHDGTDIAGCGYGSNIFAAQSGTVVVSSYKYDNGQYITIDHHNGYYSMYAHLCTGCRYVKAGDHVEKGQVIGGMGRTGAATGVHLHFSIWRGYPYRGGTALNAMSFY